jgi:uncharacterized protein (TIGR02145 family)
MMIIDRTLRALFLASALCLAAAWLSLAVAQGAGGAGTFTDSRDGKIYKTVKMPDGKTWMARNLNIKTERSWCYDNKESNCDKYGRLYDWKTAMKVCPSGWHLPSNQERDGLVGAVGGNPGAGKMLKSTSGWNDYKGASGNGTDAYGFSALPGGHRNPDGYFYRAGNYGCWWTAREYDADDAYLWGMGYFSDYVNDGTDNKENGFSVRCVGD